jgi:rubredoxin-NAD+ reductase
VSALTVVGTGLAGYTLAREFRKLESEPRLVLVTADSGAFYSKPMLSNALGKEQTPQQLVNADAEAMAERLGAEILTHTVVDRIETERRRLHTADRVLDYDRLVLALGARPIRPPIAGDAVGQVKAVNSLGDYARFRESIKDSRRVAIIGPGLIGCEFANDLLNSGIDVTVIGPDRWPISTLLPEVAGQALQSALAEGGVEWRLDRLPERVDVTNEGLRVTLSDGSAVHADTVLSAIGLRPAVELAQQAGLTTHRGIVTDRYLQTSISGVYALGDCAEVEGLNLPYVMPIMSAARALAQTLAGQPTKVSYPAMPVVIKTPPARDATGSWEVTQANNGVRALYQDGTGKLLGFALTGQFVTEKQALTRELPAILD